jgi:hypothetical protein
MRQLKNVFETALYLAKVHAIFISSLISGKKPCHYPKGIYQLHCDSIANMVPANRIEGFHSSTQSAVVCFTAPIAKAISNDRAYVVARSSTAGLPALLRLATAPTHHCAASLTPPPP